MYRYTHSVNIKKNKYCSCRAAITLYIVNITSVILFSVYTTPFSVLQYLMCDVSIKLNDILVQLKTQIQLVNI